MMTSAVAKFDLTAIARIEEASLNATVVPEQQLYHGWLVRWARSLAKRARSISVLSTSQVPIEERLNYVAELYARHGLPCIFRLTTACIDAELESAFEERGLTIYGNNTLVMAASMQAATKAMSQQQDHKWLQLRSVSAQTFAHEVGRLKHSSAEHIAEHAIRLASVAVPKQMLLAYDGQVCVGAALGVFDAELMGIFDVITDADRRRQGIARQLFEEQLRQGLKQGVQGAYLQVVVENQAAQALYAHYGFVEHHQYWYRAWAKDQV